MLALLARILLIFSTIVVVVRVLRTLLAGAAGRQRQQTTGHAPAMVRDPVCGMYLDPSLAVKAQSGRELVYFCSEECRKEFRR
jgi:YHS domain-containing protein